ncbi:MAG: four helix bundle protein [Candidatus Binatia bacterium]
MSVPSNIAEGQGRISTKEFLKHVSIAPAWRSSARGSRMS